MMQYRGGHGLCATVSRRYRREHPGDTHPLTGVEMWRHSAAAYGGYHPTDLDAAALAAALDAGDDVTVDAAVREVLEAAWAVSCKGDEDLHWPPQPIRAARFGPGHVRLAYGAGRSEAILDWSRSGATVTIDIAARRVPVTESALVLNWHRRLTPWAGGAAARDAVNAFWRNAEHAPETLEAAYAAFTASWRWHPGVSVHIGTLGADRADYIRRVECLRYLGAWS